VKDLIEIYKIKIPESLLELIDINQELKLLEPKELSILELKGIYKERVQEHRLYSKEVYNIITSDDVA